MFKEGEASQSSCGALKIIMVGRKVTAGSSFCGRVRSKIPTANLLFTQLPLWGYLIGQFPPGGEKIHQQMARSYVLISSRHLVATSRLNSPNDYFKTP